MSYYRQGPGRPSGFQIGVPGLTPFIKWIIIVSVGIWLFEIVFQRSGVDVVGWFGVVPARVIRGAVWQPLTYMFLHNPASATHILFNMLMLWMFGGELERFWGSRPFLSYYMICGVGGGISATLLGLVVGGNSTLTPTIGASGALFGLFVACGIVFAKRTILFMLIFPMQARTMALLLVGLNFFYLVSQPGSTVSYVAHLGGALTGYLYLKRAWRIGAFYRELRWKIKRRKFHMMPPDDPDDRWLN